MTDGTERSVGRDDLPEELPQDSHDLGRLSERELEALRKYKTPNAENSREQSTETGQEGRSDE